MSEIIRHHLGASPFSEKVRLIFGLWGLALECANVEMILYNPVLAALARGYPKSRVTLTGSDSYCDSHFIAVELECRFPTSKIFLGGYKGLPLALSSMRDYDLHFADSDSTVGVYIRQLPESLMRDRKACFGDFMDVENLDRQLPHLNKQLRTQVDLIEQRLSDGKSLFHGPEPVDFNTYAVVKATLANLAYGKPLFGQCRHKVSRIDFVQSVGSGQRSDMTREDAHAVLRQTTPNPNNHVDQTDAFGLAKAEATILTPDYRRESVTRHLITLTVHEVAVERNQGIMGNEVVYFSRTGLRISKD